jgi:hypothetical protein
MFGWIETKYNLVSGGKMRSGTPSGRAISLLPASQKNMNLVIKIT